MDYVRIKSLLFIAFLYIYGVVGQSFTTSPRNTHAIVGDSFAQLDCSIDYTSEIDQTIWQEFITDPDNPTGISSNSGVIDDTKYAIDGEYNLRVLNPGSNNAGKYRCTNVFGTVITVDAELIALESDPVCTTNISSDNIAIEGELISYTCEIGYTGKWAPKMTWTDETGEHVLSEDLGTPGTIVKHRIVVPITLDTEGKRYSCLTDFGPLDPAPGEGEAHNVPDYSLPFTFDPITVHFPPRDTRITPNRDAFYVGEEITCASTANPPIDAWEWKDLLDEDDAVISTSDTIVIDELLIGKTIRLSCTVFNTMSGGINGTETVDIIFTVYDSIGLIAIVAFVMLAVVLVILIIGFALFAVGKHKRGRRIGDANGSCGQSGDLVNTEQ